MENAKTLHVLGEFAKTKPKDIPKELDDYLRHVAASGDPVYQWSLVKFLFRQKLLNVVMEFYESCPMMDVPISPNLDTFNFETIKKRLLDRYDLFAGVPFTIQRIAELLTAPRKQYNRLDKYMRALEKNVWVVSTRDPATRETLDQLNLVNGAMTTDTHPAIEETETDTERLQGESDDSNGPTSDENCPKTNDINETDQESLETPLVEPIETSPELEPSESFASSESNSGDAPENISLELPTSDSDAVAEDKVEEETSEKDPTPEPDSTVDDDSTEEEKTEEIVVTEVDENETIPENVESIEPVLVIEPAAEESETQASPATEAPVEEEEAEDTDEKPRRSLKRKCEEDEEASPNKKIETESVQVEETIEAAPEVEEKTPEVTVTELLEIRDVEVSMDSTEVEEKLAMVVEEPEQAMDVDETSMQSPMVQEDAVEAMEESELAIS